MIGAIVKSWWSQIRFLLKAPWPPADVREVMAVHMKARAMDTGPLKRGAAMRAEIDAAEPIVRALANTKQAFALQGSDLSDAINRARKWIAKHDGVE